MPETERRKSGPKDGVYEKLLTKYEGEYPPLPNKLKRTNPLLHSRIKAARAVWRRQHDAKKYLKFAKWVRAIRKRMHKSQSEFARLLGVTKVTVTRWECGLGHLPATWPKRMKSGALQPSTMDRLKNLDSMSREFKKKGIKLER